ncbi:MAG: M23 family metallopeptidase [Deltaproteobacteria bacterium]|nr:M23 family metallopeptidase [Deltaproteobacteria bacterium]
MKRAMKLGLVILISLALVSCASVRSRYHKVESGDSLSKIASQYQVPVGDLRKHNGKAVHHLRAGTKLYIPFENQPGWDTLDDQDRRPASSGHTVQTSYAAPAAKFLWPVVGTLSSYFGLRNSRMHEGVDIAAPRGTKVQASRSGHVLYAGNSIAGYGNLVIIHHMDRFSTVYAHLSKIDVRKGQFIRKGQLVGRVGATGHATSSHLHFEVRNRRVPVNPLLYLQGRLAANILPR